MNRDPPAPPAAAPPPARRGRRDPGRLTRAQLLRFYLAHPPILAYLALAVLCAAATLHQARDYRAPAAAVAGVVAGYPALEYLLHRFVLHSRALYRSRWTARLWRRIHYDHHRDPDDLSVLFGAMHTTLPVVLAGGLAVGALAGADAAAIWAALAASLVALCVYELLHCIHHLGYAPRAAWLRRLKQRHLLHHFHCETGNYGIATSVVDRLCGTLYEAGSAVPRSPTSRDLGYTPAEARRYPWVAALDAPPSGARATNASAPPSARLRDSTRSSRE